MKRTLRLTSAAVSAALVVSWPVVSSGTGAPHGDGARPCPAGVLRAATLPDAFGAAGCDLAGRQVRTPVGFLTVPERGHGVGAERILAGGRTVTYSLELRRDGTLVTQPALSRHHQPIDVAAAGTGCTDTAHATDRHHFTARWKWFYHGAGLSDALVLRKALTRGLHDVSRRRSNCHATHPLPADVQPSYQGTTHKRPSISPKAGCGTTDGRSVVGFGGLTQGSWGYTCWWWKAGRVTTEVDMLLKDDLRWWTAKSITGCRNRPDLEGLAAHEFGHAYGLLHVDEAKHGDQTMSTYINGLCSNLERTLGQGDLLGLRGLYGV